MPTRFDPSVVPQELIDLTRSLGEPEKDLVILAEGNTSMRLGSDEIIVKASGANMATVDQTDFVVCRVSELVALMDDSSATQADLTQALDAGEHQGKRRRGSIETLVHVAVQSLKPTAFVAHTHPTAVVSLLASVHQATAFDRFVYSDEAAVIGTILYVPYAQPGIDLGRVVLNSLREYFDAHTDLPSLVLLANHGIIALSETAGGTEAISLMATKGARVRLAALAAGGVSPLSEESAKKFLARDDIAERRWNLSGA